MLNISSSFQNSMRLFAVGDIHGCGTALETLLAALSLQEGDKLIGLGDYVNKGPETMDAVEQLIQLYDRGILVPLLGNHELQWKLAHQLWLPEHQQQELIDRQTLNSYAPWGREGTLADIPERHWRFIEEACLAWLTTDNYVFVHANLDEQKPLFDQPSSALFWDKFNHPQPHCSGKTMVCGHTPQRDGIPINLGHAICLDTAACEGQWLSCLDINSGEVWQANQRRQLRRLHIDSFLKN